MSAQQPGLPQQPAASSSSSHPRTSRKKSANNRNSLSGSLSREPEPISLRPCSLPCFDDVFHRLSGTLGRVAAVRDVLRTTLAFFRESCGLPAPASIKRCVRNLHERSRASSSSLSSSSSSSGGVGETQQQQQVAAMTIERDRSRRPNLHLVLRGGCAVGENWRKTQIAFDNLVNELHLATEMTSPLDDHFAAALDKIARLYEDFNQIYTAEYPLEGGTAPTSSSNGGSNENMGGGDEKAPSNHERKKSGKLKKRLHVGISNTTASASAAAGIDLTLLDAERRHQVDEVIRWNYSLVEAARELCAHLHQTCRRVHDDLWSGAVMCNVSRDLTTTTSSADDSVVN